jgi:hypothetical protein
MAFAHQWQLMIDEMTLGGSAADNLFGGSAA